MGAEEGMRGERKERGGCVMAVRERGHPAPRP